jgi:signal transduction histidine kinase
MLDISLIDKDLERLAGILNQYNIRQRQAVAGVLRNEEYLKESVANISHDLRTPLTVILGHLQLLQKENWESSQAQRVKVIFSKADMMIRRNVESYTIPLKISAREEAISSVDPMTSVT